MQSSELYGEQIIIKIIIIKIARSKIQKYTQQIDNAAKNADIEEDHREDLEQQPFFVNDSEEAEKLLRASHGYCYVVRPSDSKPGEDIFTVCSVLSDPSEPIGRVHM